ncbi:MAG: DUF72 domain-containing protein [Candidatus Bathyarchaeia archaeon]
MREDCLVEILIGAGGWDYFNVPGDKLRNYARAFKTVEVNSTFYRIPPLNLVESWRMRVPEEFEFTVRCNRILSHKLRFEPSEESFEIFNSMRRICSILRAQIIHIQTPQDFKLDRDACMRVSNFLSTVNLDGLRLAWELRGGTKIGYDRFLQILQDHGIIHCVDLSRENPAYESNIIYSHLFGKGHHNIYQFSNTELKEIYGKVRASKAERAYLNFHGVRMYSDAARLSVYESSGKFPKVTRSLGVDSALEVLKEDSKFPTNTSELIKRQGWKICEWGENEQLRLSEILGWIGEKTFKNISELEMELRKIEYQPWS